MPASTIPWNGSARRCTRRPSCARLRGRHAGLFAGALLLAAPLAVAQRPAAGEYDVKVEFLERFTRFIEWPDGALGEADAPFMVCLMSADSFGPALDRLSRERRIRAREVTVRRVARAPEVEGCHLLVVGAGRGAAEVLARTRGRPVLTVGDASAGAETGTHITFRLEAGRVRFMINEALAKESGLRFSAELMRLARPASAPPQ